VGEVTNQREEVFAEVNKCKPRLSNTLPRHWLNFTIIKVEFASTGIQNDFTHTHCFWLQKQKLKPQR